jgi:hypothetical protein
VASSTYTDPGNVKANMPVAYRPSLRQGLRRDKTVRKMLEELFAVRYWEEHAQEIEVM